MEVVRGQRAERPDQLGGGPALIGQLVGVVGDQLGQAIDAVDPDRPDPGQVVEPDVLELDPVRGHAEAGRHPALDPDRHVAQPDRPVAGIEQRLGDDPDRVREVDDPGVGRAPTVDVLGERQDHGHGPKRLGEATRPNRLLADAAEPVGERLVGEPGGLAPDPELDEDERRPVDRGVPVGRRGQPAGPAVATEDALGQPGDDREPLGIDVVERELVDRQASSCDRRRPGRAPGV